MNRRHFLKAAAGAIAVTPFAVRADLPTPATAPSAARIDVVCIDEQATGYGTFQSHNQKLVANRHGIFMTHLRSRNEAFTAQQWRLSRSTDGGRSFATIYEATHATDPPVLETDADGNVYLVRADLISGDAFLYRFAAENDFADPIITPIPRGAAQKFAMLLDPQRKLLYYLGRNTTLYVIGFDGRVQRTLEVLKRGPDGEPQYPQLSLGSDGALHLAWTTVKTLKPLVWLYWDIHHALSRDGGRTWQNLDGSKLTPPWAADQSGPAMRVTLDDEFQVSTWLSNFIVKASKVHFLYLAKTRPPRQHYVRYDIATAKRDIDHQPQFRGEAFDLFGLDGFFATPDDRTDSPLYCVGRDVPGHIVALVSRDNGQTWHDYARSEKIFSAYAVGGCRRTTTDGAVIGSFTETRPPAAPDSSPKVHFFHIIPTPAER